MEVQKEEAHTDGEAILVFGLEFRVGIWVSKQVNINSVHAYIIYYTQYNAESTLIILWFHSLQCALTVSDSERCIWREVKWRWRHKQQQHRHTISETQQNQKSITVITITTIIITIIVTWWWRLSCAGDSGEACAVMESNAITLTASGSSVANRSCADCSFKTNTAPTDAPVATCIPPQQRYHRRRQLFRFQIHNLNQVLSSLCSINVNRSINCLITRCDSTATLTIPRRRLRFHD